MDGVFKIDNEMLRDQVVHFQKKIQDLEDQLEDSRVNADREENAMRSRIQKYKDNEAGLRLEAADIKKEAEQSTKSEALARAKAEEAEEALRENTFALENARAEIEGLRAEIAVSFYPSMSNNIMIVFMLSSQALESDQARNSMDKARIEEASKRAATERNRHNDEVSQLKEMLEAVRASRKELQQELEVVRAESSESTHSLSILKQTVEALDSDKAEVRLCD